MKRVIIESPYAGEVQLNLLYLRACMRDSLLRGESPFASHGLYTQDGVLDDRNPEERERGIVAGFAWRAAASKTVFYLDLGESRGMLYGRQDALQLGHVIEERRLGGAWTRAGELLTALKEGDESDPNVEHHSAPQAATKARVIR